MRIQEIFSNNALACISDDECTEELKSTLIVSFETAVDQGNGSRRGLGMGFRRMRQAPFERQIYLSSRNWHAMDSNSFWSLSSFSKYSGFDLDVFRASRASIHNLSLKSVSFNPWT